MSLILFFGYRVAFYLSGFQWQHEEHLNAPEAIGKHIRSNSQRYNCRQLQRQREREGKIVSHVTDTGNLSTCNNPSNQSSSQPVGKKRSKTKKKKQNALTSTSFFASPPPRAITYAPLYSSPHTNTHRRTACPCPSRPIANRNSIFNYFKCRHNWLIK